MKVIEQKGSWTMKKKLLVILLSTLLGAGSFSGCARTPEESLVKMKGKASEKNYEEAGAEDSLTEEEIKEKNETGDQEESENQKEEKKTSGIRTATGAPETYQSEVEDATGKLKIVTDAAVEIPDADKASAIEVSQHSFDQELIDKITAVFFPGAKFYSAESYYQFTKEDIMKKITELKGYLAEGNLDPYNHGTDENGNAYDINGAIERWEEEYEKAPETRTLEEVKPALGTEEGIDYFGGIAETAGGERYRYRLNSYNSMPMEVFIEKIYEEQQENNMTVYWSEYYPNTGFGASEEELEKKEKLSLKEARAIAQEKVDLLEIPDMEMTEWEYGVAIAEDNGNLGDAPGTIYDVGYVFHFTRKLGNIPITYTMEWGGALENMDTDMETWGYEKLNIYVGTDGICKVEFVNLYDIGETKTNQVKLKSFNEIIDIYEKMMQIKYAVGEEPVKYREFNIDRITFGYSRIYEPSADSKSGVLVPVWDFFGSITSEYADEVYTNSVKYQSYLTINAIDGSAIDRGLGY